MNKRKTKVYQDKLNKTVIVHLPTTTTVPQPHQHHHHHPLPCYHPSLYCHSSPLITLSLITTPPSQQTTIHHHHHLSPHTWSSAILAFRWCICSSRLVILVLQEALMLFSCCLASSRLCSTPSLWWWMGE